MLKKNQSSEATCPGFLRILQAYNIPLSQCLHPPKHKRPLWTLPNQWLSNFLIWNEEEKMKFSIFFIKFSINKNLQKKSFRQPTTTEIQMEPPGAKNFPIIQAKSIKNSKIIPHWHFILKIYECIEPILHHVAALSSKI